MKMKALLPKGLVFNAPKLARAIENTLEAAAKDVQVDFGVTTQAWKVRPAFRIERETGQRTVVTDDEIYGFVDEGTPPHVITAHGRGGLVFGVPARAKTSPRVIGSHGGSRGNAVVHVRQVHHPGTEPREFATTIAEKWDTQLPVLFQRSIDSEVS